ncbi:MAG: hypothetical protein AABW47_02165 [Nanoarchaeota archaeon]
MTEKELSKEEQAEQARASSVRTTLESRLIQDTLATNTILSNQSLYGSENVERAQGYYGSLTSGEDFTKEREEQYKQTADAYKKRGIFGEPSRASNADISAKLVQQFNEVIQMATLEELLTGVKSVFKSAGAKVMQEELTKELRNYTYIELIEIAKKKEAISKDGKLLMDKLSNDEQKAFEMYQTLTEAYKEACIQRVCSPLDGYNKKITEICDSYKPKPQEEYELDKAA